MMLTVFEVSDAGVSSAGKCEEPSMTMRGRAARPPTLSTPQSYQYWRELLHSAHSLAEVVGVSYPIIIHHLRDSLRMKISICAGCHMT
jgi:hypothetical protein